MLKAIIGAWLLSPFAAVADVMPLYAAMPSQVALLHRQGDFGAYAHGGINGFDF
ncbi:MAG: hypothetical protein H6Q89_3518 [Myxococcaceae bacterium]|nr:hypothetical protein [Myxococcaceae bacterium]